MAYEFINSKGIRYFLHYKDVTLKGGRSQRIYYFSRDIRRSAIDNVPTDFKIIESVRSGLPLLAKAGPHGPDYIPPIGFDSPPDKKKKKKKKS